MAQSPTAAGGGGSDRSTDGERAGGGGAAFVECKFAALTCVPERPRHVCKDPGDAQGQNSGLPAAHVSATSKSCR